MSCDAISAAAFLWLASAGPAAAPAQVPAISAPVSVAAEPLYADIVRRAGDLKAQVEAFRAAGKVGDLMGFKTQVDELAALDMKGHLDLKARGVDGDLKCILRGMAQDLPVKLQDVEKAATPKERDLALREMFYLLRDNVEVITAPPAPPV